jgi:1-acyl-sn-glycerol-3-phosphate acyltransferase
VTSAWLRRAWTIPAVTVGLAVALALAPIALPLALVHDLVRFVTARRPFMALRLYAFAIVYLLDEVLGLVALGACWFGAGLGRGRRDRLLRATYAVQGLWASVLFGAARALLGLRFEVEGDDAVRPGPLHVFVQHTSVLDTLIPTIFVTRRHGIRLRFVLKKELLVSPCLDVAGHMLPNVFVDRASAQSDREIARIKALAEGLGPGEGTLIYPEGTRATPSRRAHALSKLAASDPALHARASALRHLLPPRIGGPLALLEGGPDADCLLVGHVGLEHAVHVEDVLAGALVGRVVRVRMRRVSRRDVPAERRARIEWLYDAWQEVDDWVAGVSAGG